jgi:hypothetical protein
LQAQAASLANAYRGGKLPSWRERTNSFSSTYTSDQIMPHPKRFKCQKMPSVKCAIFPCTQFRASLKRVSHLGLKPSLSG